MKSSKTYRQAVAGIRRATAGLCVAGAVSLVGSGAARGEPVSLIASQSVSPPSSFILDFGVFGGISSANITTTEFELEIDPAAGTARFVDYQQQVDPLILPDGSANGVSTGDITVEIIESLGGTFDRATGTFVTDDVYAVHFTGDLSAFGIQSPFILPSTSTGTVSYTSLAGGTTDMEWIGEGLLAGIPFSYACAVNGSFTATISTPFIATTNPPHGAIDARQPHPVDNAAAAQGWDAIEVTFNAAPLAALTPADFTVEAFAADGTPLTDGVVVEPGAGDALRIQLVQPIAPGAWAKLTHLASGTSACLGFLPGDVNGDGLSNARDITGLVDSLNGVSGRVRPDYGTDINRSGVSNAADITALINVLNGAAEFETWYLGRLGASPCN